MQISDMNVWMHHAESTEGIVFNNINIAHADTVCARLTNDIGGPVVGVPVNFAKTDDASDALYGIGFLGSNNVSSDVTGKACTVYYMYEWEVNELMSDYDPDNPTSVDFSIEATCESNIEDDFLVNFNYDLQIDGYANVEQEVVELRWVGEMSYASATDHVITYADSLELWVEVKDSSGVGINGVPIQLRIDNVGVEPTGIISETIIYSGPTVSDSIAGYNGRAFFLYYNDLLDNQEDIVEAYIINPYNESEVYYEISTSITSLTPSDYATYLVNNISLSANPSEIIIPNSAIDSTFTINLNATVRDSIGIAIEGANVWYQNLNPNMGTIPQPGYQESNFEGSTTMPLFVSSSATGYDTLRSYVIDPITGSAISDSVIIHILTETEYYIQQIGDIFTWVNSSEILINNVNVNVTDTLFARVTDLNGGPVENVPVTFSKITPGIGYLSQSVVTTDASGLAKTVFTVNPSELQESDGSVEVVFDIFVDGSEIAPLSETITVNVEGSLNIEYDIEEFHYYPDGDALTHIIGEGSNISVIVKDEFGVGVSDVPVRFQLSENARNSNGELNTALVYTCCGDDSTSSGNQNGVATVTYTNVSGGSDILNAFVNDPINADTILHEDSITINTDEFMDMFVFVSSGELLLDNVNVSVTDTISARVTNAAGSPIPNIPISFVKETSGIGYISDGLVNTDSTGLAFTVFTVTPEYFPEDQGIVDVEFTISIFGQEEETSQTETISVNIEGANEIEYDVSEFHFYATDVPSPVSINHVTDDTTSSSISVIAKNNVGVGVSNVPIRFELLPISRDTYGVLSTALAYTCEAGDSTSSCVTSGTATVNYTYYRDDIVSDDNDFVRAYIVDPLDASNVLLEDTLAIINSTASEFALPAVSYMNAWASTPQLSITTLDSAYSDTIFSSALDINGGAINSVMFQYVLDDPTLGQLSHSIFTSDSTGIAKSIYTSLPGIVDTTIRVSVSIPDTDISSSEVEIRIIDNLPQCPECVPELSLISDYYTLPAGNENEIVIANITATMVDSLGNIPEENTGIEFEALQQDENGDWNNIGSIEPFSTFDIDGFAYTVFSMENSSGIANIIGSSNGLKDTLQIWLNSTDASFVEIVEPYPNEIMVQGGGGLESTQVTTQVRDGNGNLVSDPYWVQFEISQPAPAGTHLNGDNSSIVEVIESSNGQASVTLNAGTDPGSVRMRIEVYDYDDVSLETEIASAEGIPVTIVTGPPNTGEINYSYVDITSIGGGLYEVPVSVMLVDLHSNPVSDSTNVYFWMEWQNNAYDETVQYVVDDAVKWGTTETDSLSYICIQDLIIAGIPPTVTTYWEALDPPAQIEGEAKTGMENSTSEAFPGVAWTNVIYSSGNIFANTVLKAQTYNSEGAFLIVDSRDTHGGAPLLLPFQPGQIAVSSTANFWDFSIFGTPTDVITITATLTDYYQYPIDLGRLQLTAPGADILSDVTQYTDENGQVEWDIQYTDAVTPPTGVDPPISYQDFTSTIVVQLLDPLQTSSDPLDILLIKSQIDN